MSPWMRSAYRIVCWCWIWLHRRVVNLGCGRGGDGGGVSVLVSLSPLAPLALLGGSGGGRLFLAGATAQYGYRPSMSSRPSIQNPEWPSTQTPVGPGSLDVARTVSSPSLSFPPLCSSLSLRRRQTAEPDGRARRLAAVWRPLAASGAAEWPMTPGLAIVNGRPCGTKAHVPPAVGREIDGGSARPSCCLPLLVPQCPSAWGLATYSASFSSGTLYLHLGHRRAVNSFPLALSFFPSAPQPPPQSRQCSRRDVNPRASTLCPVPRLPPTLLPPTRAPRTR
jgi:hypothetical protein